MVSTFWATLNPVFPPPPTSAARHPAPGALGGGTWGAAHTHTLWPLAFPAPRYVATRPPPTRACHFFTAPWWGMGGLTGEKEGALGNTTVVRGCVASLAVITLWLDERVLPCLEITTCWWRCRWSLGE